MNHRNTDREINSLSTKELTKRADSMIQGFFDSKTGSQFPRLFGVERMKAANKG